MTTVTEAPVSLGSRIAEQAQERPHDVALVFVAVDGVEHKLTYSDLDTRAGQIAALLRERGVVAGDRVGVGLRNSPEHVAAVLGAWRLGAGVVTMRWDVPAWERDRLLEVTRPRVVLATSDAVTDAGVPLVDVAHAAGLAPLAPTGELPAQPLALPTGGSTGASKAVVLPVPGALVPGTLFAANYAMFGIPQVERHLILGPLYHGNPLLMLHAALFDGQQVVLVEKFQPDQVLELVRRHRPHFATLVPTMMSRLLEAPGVEDVDWACFHMVLHGTAPCPAWLKRRWIELVGPERLWEIFASSELVGSLIVRGDEWLTRPGTVGRPATGTELLLLDDAGNEVPVGEVGEVYMRLAGTTSPLFSYLGADSPKTAREGFVSVGDLASVDVDGYVYPADRRNDLIISGGANVVPAEVEAALSEHPAVADVAVIGLPDPDWGKRVHAVVAPKAGADPTPEQLIAFAKERLVSYKVPKTVELVDALPRSDMFKIRRAALVAERTPTETEKTP